MLKELEKHIKGIVNIKANAEANLAKEMAKMSEKDREIFKQLKVLADKGDIKGVNEIIEKCYKS